MSIAILLVVFVAGFLFCNRYPPARFKQLRSTGWDSYSHIASWGLIFGAAGGVAIVVVDASNVLSMLLRWIGKDLNYVRQSAPFTPREGLLIVWGTCSIALALAFGKLLNTKNAKKLDWAGRIEDLRIPPNNRLELLKGSRAGQYSIRINDQWRLCFRFHNGNATDVEIVDYH